MTEDKPAEIAGNAPEIETPRTVAVVDGDVTVTDNLHLPGELVVNGTLQVTGEVNLMESDSPNGPWTPVPVAPVELLRQSILILRSMRPWTPVPVAPVEHVKGLAKLADQYPALAQAADAGDTEADRLLTELAAASDAIIESILPTEKFLELPPIREDGTNAGDGFGPPPTTRFIALDQDLADRMAALQRDLAAWKPTTTPRGLRPAPCPLPDNLRYGSNPVHAAIVEAFSKVSAWNDTTTGYRRACSVEHYKGLHAAIGLPDDMAEEKARTLWEYLRKGGARMVKAHYALWARWYEEGGERTPYVQVQIGQFCRDLGYKPHHKGGFKRERKHEAMRLLEGLTSVVLWAVCTLPNGKAQRLRGTVWQRGIVAEERDKYADLFGDARAGDSDMWDPVAFTFAPGLWFADPEWRRFNKAVGKIGAGLMRLENDTDEWPILIGGYLGTVMRANAYKPLRLRVSTILAAANLAQSRDLKRRASQYCEKFERALDRLKEVGVIASWTWADVDTSELSDPDDPDAVAAYYSEENLPDKDWRRQVVTITLPNEKDAERLEVTRTKAIQAAERKRDRRKTRKTPEED